MSKGITRKWRPPLALVLACTIIAVLALPTAGIFALKIVTPMVGYQAAQTTIFWIIAVCAVVVGWVLWRILLRPITTLAARADDIRTGQAAALDPLEHYGTAEMEHLGAAMRQMGQVLQSREMVLRSYADHVTHELKSPLTVVQGAVELLDDPDLPLAERRKLLANVDAATRRMHDLVEAQRAFAKAHDPVAPGVCLLSKAVPVDPGIDVELQKDAEIHLPKAILSVVLAHLISNAAAHGAARVVLTPLENGLRVADDGPGISEGNRARVFDPFFTTRRSDGGTGMGLAIVQRMLAAQGAEIALEDGPGARFLIRVSP